MGNDNRVIIDFSVTGAGDVQINKIQKAVDDLGTNGQKSLGKLSGAFDVFAGSLASDLVLGGFNKLAAAAGFLFDTFVVKGVSAAIEQQDALNQLGTALSLAGQQADGALKKFDAFASEMQRTTKFQDDAVISAGALIENLTRLDEEGLERATRAAANLAAVLGKDLETTATTVAKAIEGNVGALSKFGIKVQEGATKAETFDNVMKALEGRFDGAAAAQVNTYSGALTVLENNFGEVAESIGTAIITNQSLVNVMKAANDILTDVNKSVNDQQGNMQNLVSGGVLLVIDGMTLLVTVTQAVQLSFMKLYAVALNAQGALSAATHVLTLGLTDAGKRMLETAELVAKLETEIEGLENGEGSLTKMQDGLQKLRNAAEAGLGKTADEAKRSTDNMKVTAVAIDEVSKAQQKLIDQGIKIAEQKAMMDPEKKAAAETEAIIAAFEAKKVSEEDFAFAKANIDAELNSKLMEGQVQLADSIIAENQRSAQALTLVNQESILANNEKLREILKNENLSAKDRLKVQQGLAESEKAIATAKSQAIMGTLGAFAQFANAKNKSLAAAGKAAAIAQTTINTYQSASLALAHIPPPFGFIAAAANVTAGLLNVAQIAGVGLATGLDVVPPGYNDDSFPARLSSGEGVLDKRTNADVREMAGNWPAVVGLLSGIYERLGALEIRTTVNIGSKTIVDEVREGIQSGRQIYA